MNESFPIFESQEKISRQQVIDAYKKFIERGIISPDALDLDDPEVALANKLFYKWMAQIDMEAEGNHDAGLRNDFEKTMLYVDAGFNDPEYLKDILGFLYSIDTPNAEKDTENSARVQLRHDMAKAMVKLRNMISVSEKK